MFYWLFLESLYLFCLSVLYNHYALLFHSSLTNCSNNAFYYMIIITVLYIEWFNILFWVFFVLSSLLFSLFLGLVFSTNVQFIIDACLEDFIYITNLYKFLIDLWDLLCILIFIRPRKVCFVQCKYSNFILGASAASQSSDKCGTNSSQHLRGEQHG